MNQNYELVVILDPDIKTEDQDNIISKFKKIIADNEGKVIAVKDWGKKELTYPISKKKAGFYHIINFSLPASAAPSLKQKLSLEGSILRYLLIVDDGRSKPAEVKKGNKNVVKVA